jgi:putative Holliday junction resolvase
VNDTERSVPQPVSGTPEHGSISPMAWGDAFVSAPIPEGVWLCLDWGAARIGVAACDREGSLAYPVTTVAAKDAPEAALDRLVDDYEPAAVIVGLPLRLDGSWGIAAETITAQAVALASRIAPPVFLTDERMTTGEASRKLHGAGKNTKQQRLLIDAQAAVGILDSVLTARRAGRAVGWAVGSPV